PVFDFFTFYLLPSTFYLLPFTFLVLPRLRHSGWCTLFHLRFELLQQVRATRAPAMWRATLEHDLARELRIIGLRQKLIELLDRVVQIVGVHVADVDVKLATNFGPEGWPIGAEDLGHVVILPLLGHRLVDFAGLFIPQPLGIAVRSNR